MKKLIVFVWTMALMMTRALAEPAEVPLFAAENPYMRIAIEEAYAGICQHHGGPFGAVIVKDGVIVGQGHNMVLANNDPTGHGEVSAIRNACRNLNTFDLYTTGEPCPMCLFACLWANIEKFLRLHHRGQRHDRLPG